MAKNNDTFEIAEVKESRINLLQLSEIYVRKSLFKWVPFRNVALIIQQLTGIMKGSNSYG